jgi:uncharacterized protein (TIGR02266 family)
MLIDRSFAELLSEHDSHTDPTDRRAAPRIPIETDVSIGGEGRVATGVSSDVSLGGIYVSTYRPCAVGARVSLRFRLPSGQVVASGIVRWVREARPGRLPGMGIELVEIAEIDRDVLQRFCGNRPRFLSYEEIVSSTH